MPNFLPPSLRVRQVFCGLLTDESTSERHALCAAQAWAPPRRDSLHGVPGSTGDVPGFEHPGAREIPGGARPAQCVARSFAPPLGRSEALLPMANRDYERQCNTGSAIWRPTITARAVFATSPRWAIPTSGGRPTVSAAGHD